MPNLNRVLLMGNLTRDPELRYLPSNMAVASFGMAINRRWRNQQGEQQEEVTFVDCDAWGKTAEAINQYLRKGRPIFVEGRLKLDQWDDKEGNKRSKIKVVVENFQFVDAKPGSDPGSGGGPPGSGDSAPRSAPRPNASRPPSGPGPAGNAPPPSDVHQTMDEEHIPF